MFNSTRKNDTCLAHKSGSSCLAIGNFLDFRFKTLNMNQNTSPRENPLLILV
jgi:hypothetical protein